MGRKSKAKKARKSGAGEGKGVNSSGAGEKNDNSKTDASVTVTVRGPEDAPSVSSRMRRSAPSAETTVRVSGPGEKAAAPETSGSRDANTEAAARSAAPAAAGTAAAPGRPASSPAAEAGTTSGTAAARPAAEPGPAAGASPHSAGAGGGSRSGGGSRPASGAARGAGLLYAQLATLVAGLGVAFYLIRHKLKITLDPDYESSCNLGGAINCDAVNLSQWSEFMGIPIALFAVPTYIVIAYMTWVAIQGRVPGANRLARERGDIALKAVAAIGMLTVAYSAYLGFVSSVWIRSYCLYCIALYGVNLLFTGLAFAAGAGSPVDAVRDSLKSLGSLRAPVPVALMVFAGAMALALGGNSIAQQRMEAAYKARIDAQLAEDVVIAADEDVVTATPAPASGNDAQYSKPQAAVPASPAKAAPTGLANMQSTDRGVRGGKKTDDGWTYFEPVLDDESEFWYGPADAEVTVVKYADFQCAYCRRLADSFDRVHDKYGDRVRFVMKHFPMNINCNRAMRGFDKHPVACEAAYAAHCAGEQGKFWEMHDLLYDNQASLSVEALPEYAEQLGLDKAAYDSCYSSPETEAQIREDVEGGLFAGIYGTPRTYINNRLVTGSATEAILSYYIDKALEAGARKGDAGKVSMAPKPDGTSMIEASTSSSTFFIDPYEAAITIEGKAVSQPGLEPAHADYYTAGEACEKAGKRLCTEEEWVSACTGKPAVDNNNNRMFADDDVEGDMYPYGPYHEDGYCVDREDKRTGAAAPAGSRDKCRTPSGVFDQAGNIAEWTDAANDKPTLLGGSMSSATGAACNRRSFSTPAGSRNRTTGFRCCADENIAAAMVDASMIRPNLESVVDMPVPNFQAEDTEGNKLDSTEFRGQVTLVNFFASWCGPCKKEFPYLVGYAEEFKDRGLKIVGVGVDTLAARSVDFANGFEVNFPIVTDPEALLKGKFLVYEMPATFIVDNEGVVRYSSTGFSGEDQENELRAAIEKMLQAAGGQQD